MNRRSALPRVDLAAGREVRLLLDLMRDVLAATLPLTPQEGDVVTIRSTRLTVYGFGDRQPAAVGDPAQATWELQCRA